MQLSYLKGAITNFSECKVDLSDRNDTTLVFNQTLSNKEIEILALGMILEWLRPQINRLTLLKQALSSSDFRLSSQSSHLDSLLKLKKEIKSELDQKIVEYTYNYYTSDTLKTLLNS